MNIEQIKTTLVHLHLTINLPDFQGKLEDHIFNDKPFPKFPNNSFVRIIVLDLNTTAKPISLLISYSDIKT